MKFKIKNYIYLLLGGLALINLSGCIDHPVDNERIYGSGRLVTENRSVRKFAGISVEGSASVQIIPAETESLKIQADDNIIDKVITSVEDGKLHIYLEKGSYTDITVKVFVEMNKLESLECNGSADFVTTKPFTMDYIKCVISGAASIKLAGTANHEDIEINGAGNISNYALEAAEANVNIRGTGSVEVNVTKKLDATISGTGSITYTGDPSIVNPKIFGIGSISKKR